MIILYINCSLFPFIDWIMKGLKVYETRNRNMLKSLVGKTVYIAETGKHKKPIIRCIAAITDCVKVESIKDYNRYRKYTRVKKGSCFDFTRETKQKYLYKLENVKACKPFEMPENVIRHGRVYAELITE